MPEEQENEAIEGAGTAQEVSLENIPASGMASGVPTVAEAAEASAAASPSRAHVCS